MAHGGGFAERRRFGHAGCSLKGVKRDKRDKGRGATLGRAARGPRRPLTVTGVYTVRGTPCAKGNRRPLHSRRYSDQRV
ncbi:hypothetical protein GCM10023193_56040 [Planotetraspora kaengkrachanensis]|uniref:Uncharacterized protein n=1 Tax=Planotetraspora kaengkrachanensis TaxID=575193 RepID=A0A8J3PUM2_9ACTN|nr:hypothetical protein Pka01_44890 [Planotetraspora kaengkrachanensis]